MPDRAELLNDLAEGPEGGAAWWLTASDGVRVRVGGWGAGAGHGTILLFPGRTEYIEKYGRTAQDFLDRGFATLAIDWRGQGLADRLLPDVQKGHVGQFTDYQKDVAVLLDHAEKLGFKPPYYLMAHSMGGCIGYRALHQGLPVKAAVFSGPMWGVLMPPGMKYIARPLCAAIHKLGFGDRYVFSGDPANYVEVTPFEENQLTRDPEMYRYFQAHLAARPELGIGSPTFHWLRSAMAEMRFIHSSTPRDLPVRCYIGTEEKIVDPAAIHNRMRTWRGAELIEIALGEHEVLLEVPETRNRITAEICEFFLHHPA